MKIVFTILSFLFYSSGNEPVKEMIAGTWKGSYGTEYIINDILVKLEKNDQVMVYQQSDPLYPIGKGTYKLLGDSMVVMNFRLDEMNSSAMTLYGNLNPSASFIDGEWNKAAEKGTFFLQKQPG